MPPGELDERARRGWQVHVERVGEPDASLLTDLAGPSRGTGPSARPLP